jgi:predicted HTH transcriptional regulator
MLKQNCLGCKNYFEEKEKLPLESISIEFKNYTLPLRDSKPKWIILKTITGFLNSKGGTIFIGVEDSQCEVWGISMIRK